MVCRKCGSMDTEYYCYPLPNGFEFSLVVICLKCHERQQEYFRRADATLRLSLEEVTAEDLTDKLHAEGYGPLTYIPF